MEASSVAGDGEADFRCRMECFRSGGKGLKWGAKGTNFGLILAYFALISDVMAPIVYISVNG
jgi:hypothetical protein